MHNETEISMLQELSVEQRWERQEKSEKRTKKSDLDCLFSFIIYF